MLFRLTSKEKFALSLLGLLIVLGMIGFWAL